MIKQFGHFIQRQVGNFVGWLKLLFAEDDDHRIPGAPTMKNFILFVLLAIFSLGFLKVIYLMEVVVRHEVHANVSVKSVDTTQTTAPAQDIPTYSFQIPDIPGGWQTVFLAGLGIMAGLSGAKKIAEFKYGGGNGNGNGKVSDVGQPPKP